MSVGKPVWTGKIAMRQSKTMKSELNLSGNKTTVKIVVRAQEIVVIEITC